MARFRTLPLVVAYAVAFTGVRLTVASPERCPAPAPAEARAGAARAAAWLVANQRDDGAYLYLADDEGRDLGGYSIVRHAGVTLSLYQAARAGDDAAVRAAADRGLAWMLDRLRTRDGWSALAEGDQAPLGGSALMLASLAERRLDPALRTQDAQRHDGVMRALGRFLVAMQRPDGDFFVSANVATGAVDREGTSPYFAGEALWALARLEHALPDPQVRAATEQGARFAATGRDDRDFVPVPPLNDHWGSYAFAEMADRPLADDVAAYARDISARFHLLIRWEAQGDAGAPYTLTHGPDRRAAAVGTWVEGQAALARLARADERLHDLRGSTLDSAACGADVLLDRQRDATDPRVDGAWFTGGETRMDDQQHAISGLLAVADLVEGDSGG